MAIARDTGISSHYLKIISLFPCSYTIMDYKLEQYFSLTPNQPVVNNPRSFTTKQTCYICAGYNTDWQKWAAAAVPRSSRLPTFSLAPSSFWTCSLPEQQCTIKMHPIQAFKQWFEQTGHRVIKIKYLFQNLARAEHVITLACATSLHPLWHWS